jgi:hypothetical protein
MTKPSPYSLDLSSLPPEVRQKVEAGLARLSPEARKQWLEKGSPLLDRLVAGVQATGAQPPKLPPRISVKVTGPRATGSDGHPAAAIARRLPPRGHYNDTIRPGDRPGITRWVLTVLGLFGLLAYYWR